MSSSPDGARRGAPTLIPRTLLFGNPVRTQGRLSPRGTHLSYLAPRDGVLNIWLRSIGADDDRPLTNDRHRGISLHYWACDNRHILFRQDKDGDENWHIHATNIETGETRDLTPFENIQAGIVSLEPTFPDSLLFQMNRRDPRLMDLFHLELTTGDVTPIAENPGHYVGWIPDHEFRVRAAYATASDGGFDLLARAGEDDEFQTLVHWGPEDDGHPYGFTPFGDGLYIGDSRGANTIRLKVVDIPSGVEHTLAHDERVDVDDVVIHPVRHNVEAVAFNYDRTRWTVLDNQVGRDFERLTRMADGDFSIVSRDLDDRSWLLAVTSDRRPDSYFLYDRDGASLTHLFSTKPALEQYPLCEMRFVEVRARDGLLVPCYLTLPAERPPTQLPLVVNVHGGPWHRDSWMFHSEVQWMANRGYAVLQVNFRGSTGFGKQFLHAGDKEWGGKMQDDITDAVNWAAAEGYADPERLAIYGGSYGGYASLAGAAFTPDLYRCAVAIVGPSNILSWMAAIPPYWEPMRNLIHQRVGHPEKDEQMLRKRSPLFSVEKIKIPMLIAQGANDPRVPRPESEQMVAALRAGGHEVEYVCYMDEGHGLQRPENRLDFYARAEKFLARHLGGQYEE